MHKSILFIFYICTYLPLKSLVFYKKNEILTNACLMLNDGHLMVPEAHTILILIWCPIILIYWSRIILNYCRVADRCTCQELENGTQWDFFPFQAVSILYTVPVQKCTNTLLTQLTWKFSLRFPGTPQWGIVSWTKQCKYCVKYIFKKCQVFRMRWRSWDIVIQCTFSCFVKGVQKSMITILSNYYNKCININIILRKLWMFCLCVQLCTFIFPQLYSDFKSLLNDEFIKRRNRKTFETIKGLCVSVKTNIWPQSQKLMVTYKVVFPFKIYKYLPNW